MALAITSEALDNSASGSERGVWAVPRDRALSAVGNGLVAVALVLSLVRPYVRWRDTHV